MRERKRQVFDPKQVYDFELEKTMDEKVLLKQLEKRSGDRTEAAALRLMLRIQTGPLVRFLVLRSPRNLAERTWRRIPSGYSVTAPVDRVLVLLFQRG